MAAVQLIELRLGLLSVCGRWFVSDVTLVLRLVGKFYARSVGRHSCISLVLNMLPLTFFNP